jgi:hypothetical protein
MKNKERINELNKLRYQLINEQNEAWEESKSKDSIDVVLDSKPNRLDEMIDEYAKEIRKLIEKSFENLEFEFIVEQLSNLGDAPCLLYDDNGNWSVSGSGYASVSLEVNDWEGSFFVKKEDWYKTPREALRAYVFVETKNIKVNGNVQNVVKQNEKHIIIK